MGQPVKTPPLRRTRRAEQAAETGRRILRAAADLFTEVGYAAATVEAIAARADVAVETVYSRFRNKSNLLAAVLEPGIVGNENGIDLLDLPEIAQIRDCTDQREQLWLLAAFSTGILSRVAQLQLILARAAAADPKAAELQRRDTERRLRIQAAYVQLLLANGPLRDGLSAAQATDTYSALANPTTFAFLTKQRGWSAEQYQTWLGDSLIRLLLPSPGE